LTDKDRKVAAGGGLNYAAPRFGDEAPIVYA
jgi:hypothetical protein